MRIKSLNYSLLEFCVLITIAHILICTTSAHANNSVKVFLLAGQSNMVGRGMSSELPTPLQMPQDDVLFFHQDNAALTTLRPGTGQNTDKFGPEITFGRTIADGYPEEIFAIFKGAAGGTSLWRRWNPNTVKSESTAYKAFINTVTDGLNALTCAGYEYEIVGMLWTQGERDAKDEQTTAQYEENLKAFIEDIRARYGTNLPFYISRLSDNQTKIDSDLRSNIQTAQENVCSENENTYIINTDAVTVRSDELHFDTRGQIDLGILFGNLYLESS